MHMYGIKEIYLLFLFSQPVVSNPFATSWTAACQGSGNIYKDTNLRRYINEDGFCCIAVLLPPWMGELFFYSHCFSVYMTQFY